MNRWTQKSIERANQTNYLDSLSKIYPMATNSKRTIDEKIWAEIKTAFSNGDNATLISKLLTLDLFPIKDSYVAYLKRDSSAIARNPETVKRIADALHKMELEEIYEKCSQPKETNRQIGPLFKKWIESGVIGVPVLKDAETFLQTNGNAILNASDAEMKKFAEEYLGYKHNKGLDFVARFNQKYVIGEAKFLTDFGGHQAAQFADAISTITSSLSPNKLKAKVVKIAICDGVLYLNGRSKMYKHLQDHNKQIILSGLLLNDFLLSL